VSEREHHGEKELAAFIRAGAARRHDQAFGDYFKGRNASCALGAAYEGMYRLPDNADGTRPTKDLDWFFDCLEGSRRCPARLPQDPHPRLHSRTPERRPSLDTRADCRMARGRKGQRPRAQ
jgi:hypothetical protein